MKFTWSVDQILALNQNLVSLCLILVYGFWTHRHEADDEEFISKESGASIFAKLSFSWINPLIKEGNSRSLEQNDLWGLLDDDRADLVLQQYRQMRYCNNNCSNPLDSLTWRIFKFCYPYIIYQNVCSLISSLLQFSGPYFLLQIISALEIPDVDRTTIIPSLLGLFFCSVLQFIINGQVFFTGRRVGTRARTILIEELYSKSLHRVEGTGTSCAEGDEQASLGKVVTLMSVDTERVRDFLCYIHDPLVHIPVIILVSITSLFFVLGWSAVAGVIVILILGPISTLLGKLIIDIQEEQLQNTDSRVSVMNELLQGIRIVKYFAWENYFKKKIEHAREKELSSIVKLWKVYIAYGAIGHGSGIVIAFATFFVYVIIFGNKLSASTAFTAINLLNIVRQGIMYLPSAIMQIFKAKVSMDRIDSYLKEKDIAKYSTDEKELDDEASEAGTAAEAVIGFQAASFRYYNSEETIGGDAVDSSSPPFNLRNLDVNFPEQKLSVICGPTGSGKSSLLLALLGELECTEGQYFLPKSDNVFADPITGLTNTVAYAAQTAWLLNATVRDNILFGEEYDAKRYEAVVRGCALAKDFENLDGGDLTEIGEKGVNVSGGQKQRISLARACYSRSAIVFLDDPLSAVLS
jgi:ABC-type multidrug transport system fused ATPase/permease subunit